MKFSIIIPSWNNLNYLKLCLDSIKKNSNYKHDINIHLNEATDGSLKFVKDSGFKFTHSKENKGLCSGANLASALSETDYILYSHDDMYFLPDWDLFLKNEVNKMSDNLYYFSGTMIGPKGSGLPNDFLNCGINDSEFDENKLLSNYKNINYFDHQGTHWAPHLIHKSLWDKIGGFSEEFNPGFASDTDLNMKLWKSGVRIFKGIDQFRVYHFGSISLRKKKELIRNKGNRNFLIKWGISSELFIKFYLRSNTRYDGPLKTKPLINFKYFVNLFLCKLKLFFLKIIPIKL